MSAEPQKRRRLAVYRAECIQATKQQNTQPLSLQDGKFIYRDIEKVCENLSFTTRVDTDKLYDESATANCILEQLLKDTE